MKELARKFKRNDTGLFFDSFKHFKHNLSNLIAVELPTLYKFGAKKYLNLIPTNYKSKYPDMRKIGLIDYDKPLSKDFKLTIWGEFFMKNLKLRQNFYDESFLKSGRKNISSLSASKLISCFDELESYRYEMLTIILSYYDTSDMIRPYLSLLIFLKHHKFTHLDKDILQNILAHNKEQILLMHYDKNAFIKLDKSLQAELRRPISYIYNFLQSALIIDEKCKIIVDYTLVDMVIAKMNKEFVLYEQRINSRPAKEQRAFRENVLKAYDYKCAITRECICVRGSYLLEAAHIIPYKDGGSFATTNGIALSYEMHKMFDKGLFGFVYEGDKIKIQTSNSSDIKDETGILDSIKDKNILLPKELKFYPAKIALEYNLKKYLIN
ncbi:HNH endonuclease [Campylobacter troglodytis]|uniref:HNH endonuclease n=1 Tax=Campylobacter troglodytis TaxID=654363 RepID=UPI00115B5ABC|nr:HNH endonuclease [Campylobacter troglodytis]TQR61398.1 HNH endonuclease [Campylobacter troglodytis]